MVVDMATLPMMVHTFLADTIYAPVPDPSKSDNNDSRKLYSAYLKRGARVDAYSGETRLLDMTFIEFARLFRLDGCADTGEYKVRLRVSGKGRQAKKTSTAIGVRFAFELLDIYVGQFCAMFIVHTDPSEFLFQCDAPDGARFLQGALKSKAVAKAMKAAAQDKAEMYKNMSIFDYLLSRMLADLTLRGAKADRKKTFSFRLQALYLLLQSHARGDIDAQEWSARKPTELPHRLWSTEQQAFLSRVAEGMSHADANITADRFLYLCGEPGSGKTEVIIYAAAQAAQSGAKILIGCPTGSLVATYRDRLPSTDSIVIETLHSAFAIRRGADAATYDAPSRLRHFDLFIIDESSQVEDAVFQLLLMSILEMSHKPFVVFAGDFAQLQPVSTKQQGHGTTTLHDFTMKIESVTLLQHEHARSKDPVLMDFLTSVRTQQPSRAALKTFFKGKHLKGSLEESVAFTIDLERRTKQGVMWLTVTNLGSAKVNNTVLEQLHGLEEGYIADQGYPGDPKAGADKIVVKVGMRLRLSRNLDKDRGFVNGALGLVTHILNAQATVFTMRLTHGAMVLVHPIFAEGRTFLPCAYGYAMTIRRRLSVRSTMRQYFHTIQSVSIYAIRI